MQHIFDVDVATKYGLTEAIPYRIETRPQAEIDSLLKEWSENNA